MNMSENAAVTFPKEILFTELGPRQFVILATHSGAYYELEDTSGFLWSLWRKDGSIAHSIEQLVEHYQVDRTTAEKDVLELVAELEQHGLIEVSGGE